MNELQSILAQCRKSKLSDSTILSPDITIQIRAVGNSKTQSISLSLENWTAVNVLLDEGWILTTIRNEHGCYEYQDFLYNVIVHRGIFMELSNVKAMVLPLELIDLETTEENPYYVFRGAFFKMTEMDKILFYSVDGLEVIASEHEGMWIAFEFIITSDERLRRSPDR